MESKNKELTEALNALIKINIDRAAGYEKAIIECRENFPDLTSLFGEFASESRNNITVLKTKVTNLGAEAASNSTLSGKIYSVWTDIKWAFTGVDRQGILETCTVAEEAARNAYEKALSSEAEMSAETRQILISQIENIKHRLDRFNSIKTPASQVVNL